jgi:Peptidase C13 family
LRSLIVGLVAMAALCAPMAGAQGPAAQQDPFRTQVGAVELAFSPPEALRQHALIGAALNALSAQRPGVQDVYVIAAGLWGDPVFEREASRSAAALAQSLGAQGRTIVLSAGGEAGGRTLPAASPVNLQLAIGQVGSLINPAEDLVVVFLTSHGSPAGVALHEQTRLRGTFSPTALANSLRDAGITRRVVIVSACFSGVFVPALANDDTIVLTAAARDRTSFGCEPNNEWTFFGDALINQGVMQGKPLLRAFEDGRALISQWETRDRVTPSLPQSYVGDNALRALQAIEGQQP